MNRYTAPWFDAEQILSGGTLGPVAVEWFFGPQGTTLTRDLVVTSVAGTAFTATVLASAQLDATAAAGATLSATVHVDRVLSESAVSGAALSAAVYADRVLSAAATSTDVLTATCIPAPQELVATAAADAALTATVTPSNNSAQSGVRRWLQEYYEKYFAQRDAAKKAAPVVVPAAKKSTFVLRELEDDTPQLDAALAKVQKTLLDAQQTQVLAAAFVQQLRATSALAGEQLKLSDAVVTLHDDAEARRLLREQQDEEDSLLLSMVL